MREGPNSNVDVQKRLRGLEKKKRRRQEADVRHVMATPEGRRFVWRLLEQWTHFFDVPVGCNPADFFFNGQRQVGGQLWTELNRLCPDAGKAMYDEQHQLRAADALERRSAEEAGPEADE